MLVIAARTELVLPAFTGLGLVCGLSAGPIMALPARVLTPGTRAVGMGVFYTLYYLVVVLGSWIGGYAANISGNARITFDLGAMMLLACCAAVQAFHKLSGRPGKPVSADGAVFKSIR
ncbi:hypothetical protein ACVDG5_014965 [Mesorhizobium sp. ORM6]